MPIVTATREAWRWHGAMHAGSLLLRTRLDPEDEVVLFSPSFFYGFTEIAGASPRYVPLEEKDDYRLNIQAAEAVITPRTRLLVLINPGNPTGTVAREDRLKLRSKLSSAFLMRPVSVHDYDHVLLPGRWNLCPKYRWPVLTAVNHGEERKQ